MFEQLSPQPDASPERPLLRHVPHLQRGPLMNLFLEAPRAGETDPHAVVTHVITELKANWQRRRRWNTLEQLEPFRQTLIAVMAHPDEVLELAKEAIHYVTLSPEERARLKASRRPPTGHLPATEKQRQYLRALGCATAPAHRLHASQLIDARLKRRSRHG
jgi:hypothetical protein